MIKIKYRGIEATLDDGIWECKDKLLKRTLKTYNEDSIEEYSPFKDLTIAKLFTKEIGGKIIKITGAPKTVKGRIY